MSRPKGQISVKYFWIGAVALLVMTGSAVAQTIRGESTTVGRTTYYEFRVNPGVNPWIPWLALQRPSRPAIDPVLVALLLAQSQRQAQPPPPPVETPWWMPTAPGTYRLVTGQLVTCTKDAQRQLVCR